MTSRHSDPWVESEHARPGGGAVSLTPDGASRWRSTEEAAEFLGMPLRVLRDALTEHARVVEGVVEAAGRASWAAGVGRRWKVWLGEQWTAPENAGCPRSSESGMVRAADSIGHGSLEKPHGRA